MTRRYCLKCCWNTDCDVCPRCGSNLVPETGSEVESSLLQRMVRELAETVERWADAEDGVVIVGTAYEHTARVAAGAAYRRVGTMLRSKIEKLPNDKLCDGAEEKL